MNSFIISLCLFNIVLLVEHQRYFGVTASKLPGYGNNLHTSAESAESKEDEYGYHAHVNPVITISNPSNYPPPDKANQVPSAPMLSYGTPQVAPIPAVPSGPPLVEQVAPTPDIIPSPALSYGTPFVWPSAAPVKPDAASPINPVAPTSINNILPISGDLTYGKPENPVKPEEPVAPTSVYISPPIISLDTPVGSALSYGTPLVSFPLAPVAPTSSPPVISPPGSSTWG